MMIGPMMYHAGFCRICKTGVLGVRRCGQCGNIVLLCDECDAAWNDAQTDRRPQYAKKGDLPCLECGSSLIDPPSHWASYEQLQEADWLQQAIQEKQIEIQQGEAFLPKADDKPQSPGD